MTLKTQGRQTLEQIRAFLEGSQALGFEAPSRDDANEVSTMVTYGFLQRMGIQTADIASNGQEAIDYYRNTRKPYDLVLMDCDMPSMDGYQATRSIRSWETSKGMPGTIIIALSAHAMPHVVQRGQEAGMNEQLAKPLHYGALLEKILKLFPDSESLTSADRSQAA